MYEFDFDEIILDQQNFNFLESTNQIDLTGLDDAFIEDSQEDFGYSEKIVLIQNVIMMKKENLDYKKRIKFLDNLLESKREVHRLAQYGKTEFIKHAKEKEIEIKMKLNIENDENIIETYYPINTTAKNNFKTTEKKRQRKNKKN